MQKNNSKNIEQHNNQQQQNQDNQQQFNEGSQCNSEYYQSDRNIQNNQNLMSINKLQIVKSNGYITNRNEISQNASLLQLSQKQDQENDQNEKNNQNNNNKQQSQVSNTLKNSQMISSKGNQNSFSQEQMQKSRQFYRKRQSKHQSTLIQQVKQELNLGEIASPVRKRKISTFDYFGSPKLRSRMSKIQQNQEAQTLKMMEQIKKGEKEIQSLKGMKKLKMKIKIYKQQLNMLLDDPTSSKLAFFICMLILFCIFLSCIEIIIDSIINGNQENANYKHYSQYFEMFLFIIFGVEYVLRLISSNAFGESICQFLISPMNVIDFLSILPFLLSIFSSSNSLSGLRIVRAVRFTRVFRIFKVSRYVKGLILMIKTIQASLKAMSIVFVIIVIVNIFTAVLIYYAEGNLIKQDNEERSQIQTIPDAMWWSVLTMTTIGYGDKVPHSIFGKIIACFTAFMGITVIAMPVAILGTNFSQTYENQQEQEQITEIKADCFEEHRQNQNIETVDQMNQDEKNRIFMNTRLLLLYDNNQELFELLNSSNQMYEVVSQNIQTLYEALGDHFDLNLDKTKGKLTVKEMQKKKDQEKKKLKATKLFLHKNQNNNNVSINQNNTQNQSNIIQIQKNQNDGSTSRLVLQANNNMQNNSVQKKQQNNNSRNDENLIFSNQMEKALKQHPQNLQVDNRQSNQDTNQQNDNILEKIQEEESQKFGSMVNSIQTPLFDLKKSLITQNKAFNNTKTDQNKQNENLLFIFEQQNNSNNFQQNNTATFRNLKKNQSQEIQLINELKSKNFSASPTKSNNFLVFSGQNSDDQSWYTSQVKSGLTTQHRQQNSHNSQQTEIKNNQSQNQNNGVLQKQMQNYNLQNFGVEGKSNESKNAKKNNNPYQKEKYQQQFFPQSDMKQMSLKKLNSEGNVYNSQTSMQFHDGFYQQLGSPYSNNNNKNSHNQFSSSTSIFFQKNQQKIGANNIKFANSRNGSDSSRNIEEKFIQKNKKISEDIKEDLNSQSQLLKYEQQEKQIQEQNEMINNLSVYDILNFLDNKNSDQIQQEQNQTQNKSQDKNLFKEQNKEYQTLASYQNMSLKELLQLIQQKHSKTKQKLE